MSHSIYEQRNLGIPVFLVKKARLFELMLPDKEKIIVRHKNKYWKSRLFYKETEMKICKVCCNFGINAHFAIFEIKKIDSHFFGNDFDFYKIYLDTILHVSEYHKKKFGGSKSKP